MGWYDPRTGPTATQLHTRAAQQQRAAANGTGPNDQARKAGLLPDGATLEACRGPHCGAQVFFAYYEKKDGTIGKPQPINWPPTPGAGDLAVRAHLYAGKPVVHKPAAPPAPGVAAYTTHYATCPDAAMFRRGGRG